MRNQRIYKKTYLPPSQLDEKGKDDESEDQNIHLKALGFEEYPQNIQGRDGTPNLLLA